MNQTLFERWNRISLRTKITGVTVLMLTLGLLVSGIGTAAMLRSYVEDQMDAKLEAIASGDMSKYFESDADRPRAQMNLNQLDFAAEDEVFIAVYTVDGEFQRNNWEEFELERLPDYPSMLTRADVTTLNSGHFETFQLRDSEGEPTFRAVAALMTADPHGTYVPVLIAISAKDTERLLAAYLTIFLGF